jgi:hypothetical protein
MHPFFRCFRRRQIHCVLVLCLALLASFTVAAQKWDSNFKSPPDSARPWVYWYFMDGNLTREGMTADLEAMKKAGIGGAIFLEVDIGVPRGPVHFMSEPWQELVRHAIAEAERLGIDIALGAGPGWCGTGGPWVKPEQSMQHVVASETNVIGPTRFSAALPRPQPRKPFFGEGTLTPELAKQWREFYEDVAVLAFPTPEGQLRITDIDEKALYYRGAYSSQPGIKPFLPAPAQFPETPSSQQIASEKIVDLTDRLSSDGVLQWDIPAGNWTILRFGRTATGQTTRPAPLPGLGFESDKFDKKALTEHFDAFAGKLIRSLKTQPDSKRSGGLTTVHFDSWEMCSQNWSPGFAAEFRKRRGYDLLKFLPVMTGRVIDSVEVSERFLWDLRQTAQELVVENHAEHLKTLSRQHDLLLSIEPYDLNPTSDLTLGAVADVPMCEFWYKGFNTTYSVLEAASIAHTTGRSIVGAESFTSEPGEDWQGYPWALKNLGDWAFAAGVNRIAFHRYQHQPWLDRRPGMRMGPYGVHWERTQTWWNMVPAYHTYLARCQFLLRQGSSVADVLYLVPEGAPHVFSPPESALRGTPPDRASYNFDGCSPETLRSKARVNNGRIEFPGGTSYRLLVLPQFDTMTPELLAKIKELVVQGATILGAPPQKSPGLSGFPECDQQVKQIAEEIWGDVSGSNPMRHLGKGRVFLDEQAQKRLSDSTHSPSSSTQIYPHYDAAARILRDDGIPHDFESQGPLRYTHRQQGRDHLYFVANQTGSPVHATSRFRVSGLQPELWDPLTGDTRVLRTFEQANGVTTIPLDLAPYQSYFVVFRKSAHRAKSANANFPQLANALVVKGPWSVQFDPKWGGPESVVFPGLLDWARHSEPGVSHYSGEAVYSCNIQVSKALARQTTWLELGRVEVMAKVRVNGRDCGTVWCAPWQVELPQGTLHPGDNRLEITVANLWINRLIADSALPEEKRLTWTTSNPYKPDSKLVPSGLLGPVTLKQLSEH